jgi:hypothetical protein
MATRFLFNEALWQELSVRIAKAKAQAAVAYLGSGASSLLPLKKGDGLVVDAESIRWSRLRRILPSIPLGVRPRTRPIADDAQADSILRLWDARGRFKGRKQ